MKLNILKPRKAINKAFLKIKPNRTVIENFKTNLIQLLDRINDTESEEFHKNLVTDFLKKTYYEPNHFINTKGRNDLVIHNGNKPKSTVGVIIEAKKPTNKAEMLKAFVKGDTPEKMLSKINVKAFQELILYYLRERITHKNLEIKYLVATNINEWFIFDSNVFEKQFAQNKGLVKQFNDFENGRLAGKTTDFFYKEIAEPFINDLEQDIEFTFFDIREYENPLRNDNPKDDNKLIALFKLLSPEHLLKLPFTNDSNSLDKRFYGELLHIIGLAETKQGGKKLIERNKKGERNTGSFLENAIIQLDSLDKINRLDHPSHFGTTQEERLFNVGLELSITWINRILFLKLLEAQLKTYHKGDKSYEFLSIDKIQNYDDLNSLFFQVLAKQQSERNEDIIGLFSKVPYLNSSLFEPTEIEHGTLFISNLRDDKTIPIYASTVLKSENGKKLTGHLSAIEYLFEFLDAYDFSSEGSEEIQEDNKTLINASVLGLIFEKINGYKDGSFFTPGFITMYMCRETIRKAIVQKFNDTKDWNCKDMDSIYDKIEDRQEANTIINSLKICDPAVGSGHFLVSALNEIIAIKNDLKILQDRDGKRLKEYVFEVVNDELIVTDEDGELFEYNPTNRESQRIQETLFHEKQTLIENCLFGVDINPNSVKICRLRLWIELLKNAYYKNESELETLPNIDINIKCGNSLISRFELDADLKKALKSSKWTIDSYRIAVDTYRNAQNKEQKRAMEKLIDDIKNDFRSEISLNDPKVKKYNKLQGEIFGMTNQTQMFELTKREKAAWNRKLKQLAEDSKKLEIIIEEIKNNKIYEDAFEWRFEFPEVLDDDGGFLGFDVVIGNPPYGLFNKKQNKKIALTTDKLALELLKQKYPEATGGVINAARIFYAFGIRISSKTGYQCMIIPYGVLTDTTSVKLRKYIFNNHSLIKVEAFPERDNTKRRVFEDVKMSTAILLTSSSTTNNSFDIGVSYDRQISENRAEFKTQELVELNPELVQIPLTDTDSFNLLSKIYKTKNLIKLGSISPCLTGEVDMTFGKSALTKNNNDKLLLKGAQIDRFIMKTEQSQISQGDIEFINEIIFNNIGSSKKIKDSKTKRIALQGLTGVNEKHRLKVTYINENIFLANSCNYLLKPKNYELELLLGWLNSSLLNFVFKTRSTSSNVNGYEVDNLPFIDSESNLEIKVLSDKILDIKRKDINRVTSLLEKDINYLIYNIFNLNENEIKIIEEANS
jgi:Alw26I/Eco31I/Esp3I family type II restriction m6 adenine DNA methyltransferase